MWMDDAYVQELLLRERIGQARRDAATDHLLHGARPPRTRSRFRDMIARRVRRAALVAGLRRRRAHLAS